MVFEAAICALPRPLSLAFVARAWPPKDLHRRLPGLRRFCRSALWPFLGENFFPAVDSGQILMHVRAQSGTRIEETARLFDRSNRPSAIDSAGSARQHSRQYRAAVFRHQHGLPEHRHHRTRGRRRLDQPQGRSRTDRRLTKRLRTRLPQKFPAATFSFLPADIVSQILNFGLPAPIDVQVIGHDQKANYAYATDLLKHIRLVSGIADLRIQQVFNYPQINVDVDQGLPVRSA